MELFQTEKCLVGKGNKEWEDSLHNGKRYVVCSSEKKTGVENTQGLKYSTAEKVVQPKTGK